MGDYSDEGEYWARQRYRLSESDVVTSDTVTSNTVVAPQALPEKAPAAENGDCFVKPKPLEAWFVAVFPKSSFATRIAAPTPCAVQEPVVKKPSVVFACP